MRAVTLPELSALAAGVEGFVRPFHKCARCNGRGEFFHDVLHDDVTCAACDGTKGRFDNSPTALLMAVVQCSLEFHALEHEIVFVRGVRGGKGAGRAAIDATGAPNDDIARAALVALLRAHGVEVSDEP